MTHRLIVFTRQPVLGKVKSRLAVVVGDQQALSIHTALVQRTVAVVADTTTQTRLDVLWYVADLEEAAFRSQFGVANLTSQATGDLGLRLRIAFEQAIVDGIERVVVIGTDCPTLTDSHIQSAIKALDNHDIVLGPAADGGYYLLGMCIDSRRFDPREVLQTLFTQIDWGTDRVLQQTMSAAASCRLSVERLETLADVDYVQDLIGIRGMLEQYGTQFLTPMCNRLSVIIPTFNEAKRIEQTVSTIRTRCVGDVEVIVVDGGSSDDTIAIAQRLDARVLEISGPRGVRLNAGAVVASGESLCFVHADSDVPQEFDRIIQSELTCAPVPIVGAFSLRIRRASAAMQAIAAAANFRSRWLSLPYGDQAYFIYAQQFEKLGGYRRLPLMDDFEFIVRCRKHGRIRISRHHIECSNRRWKSKGVIKTTLTNQFIVAAYLLGVSPQKLARWYRNKSN